MPSGPPSLPVLSKIFFFSAHVSGSSEPASANGVSSTRARLIAVTARAAASIGAAGGCTATRCSLRCIIRCSIFGD